MLSDSPGRIALHGRKRADAGKSIESEPPPRSGLDQNYGHRVQTGNTAAIYVRGARQPTR
ncbi:hypothetical protein RS83_00635 [Microbacterium oxydans]|uniref:Uncharacterized protein n=1 Tax=Microbacterium oxydans TaxID=82380 RepID=A0A0F0LG85_9MICO|nr:hypothetical protein RS83_00635 [Microbacterium oxydans]